MAVALLRLVPFDTASIFQPMQIRRIFNRTLATAVTACSLAACGDDARPAEVIEAPSPSSELPADPLARIPPEELYGASPIDNLWSPRFEAELVGVQGAPDSVRVAIVSDFQIGLWEENDEVAAAAIRQAVQASPDLIFLLGDYVAPGGEIAAFERALAPLRGRRVIAVLGDRDVRSDSVEARVIGALEGVGATVLRNSAVDVDVRGGTLTVAGLHPDLLSSSWNDQQWVIRTITDPETRPILLTHVPALASRAPDDRFPVIIGGNTFCGTVEVPGTPRLSWLREEALPGAAVPEMDRLFRVQGSTLLVTCGIGYGFVPLRFGAPPEVPLLTLIGGIAAPADTLAVEDPAPDADSATP